MRRTILLIAAFSLLLLPAGGAAADSGNPFQGSWVGGDPAPPDGDGSVNTFRVGGGNNYLFYDTPSHRRRAHLNPWSGAYL